MIIGFLQYNLPLIYTVRLSALMFSFLHYLRCNYATGQKKTYNLERKCHLFMMLYVCSLDLLVSIMFYECYASRFWRRSDKVIKILIFASFFSPFIFYLHKVTLMLSIIQASFGFWKMVLFLPTVQIREISELYNFNSL